MAIQQVLVHEHGYFEKKPTPFEVINFASLFPELELLKKIYLDHIRSDSSQKYSPARL